VARPGSAATDLELADHRSLTAHQTPRARSNQPAAATATCYLPMLLSFGDCDTLLLWRITNTACSPSRPLILTPASASGIISHPKQYRRRFKQPKTLCTALATSPTRCSACHSDRRGGFWAVGHAVSIRNLTAPHRRFGPLTRPALGFLPPTTAERLNVWDAQCSSFLLLNEHMLAARGTVSQQQYMSHPLTCLD
jgi:hypothetical protein